MSCQKSVKGFQEVCLYRKESLLNLLSLYRLISLYILAMESQQRVDRQRSAMIHRLMLWNIQHDAAEMELRRKQAQIQSDRLYRFGLDLSAKAQRSSLAFKLAHGLHVPSRCAVRTTPVRLSFDY